MNAKNTLLTLGLFAVSAVFSACTPAEGVLQVQVQPAGQTTPDEPEGLREIALAFLSGSITDRLDHIQFLTTPCTTADGLGGPPKCAEGVAEGTPVEVFPLGGPEGSFADRETIEGALDFVVKNLYAVTRVPEDAYSESYWPAGAYALIFDRDINDYPVPVTVLVQDGKVVRLNFTVGTSVSEQLMGIPVELVLVPPEDMPAWLSGVSSPAGQAFPD